MLREHPECCVITYATNRLLVILRTNKQFIKIINENIEILELNFINSDIYKS